MPEPKLRRGHATTAPNAFELDTEPEKPKAHRCGHAGGLPGQLSAWRRRLCDVLAVSGNLGIQAGLYYLTMVELLPAAHKGKRAVRIWAAIGHVLYALFLLSWAGVVYHGPGRVPQHVEEDTEPPDLLAGAFDVGFWAAKPFGPRAQWCEVCRHWKPALANHCSICNRCSLWMDHHCNFIGTCIGFRNMRCMLVWLFYTQVLLAYLALLSFRRLFVGPALSLWVAIHIQAFIVLWLFTLWLSGGTFWDMMEQVSWGWPSGIQLRKFWGAAQRADRIRNMISMKETQYLQPRKELHEALLVVWQRGHVLGPFSTEWGGLLPVFGEPPSWRWLLPLRPGGKGDPLRPQQLDPVTCQGWATLGKLGPSLPAHRND